MVYECRTNRFRRHHIYTALATIAGLFLLSRFDWGGGGYWWSYSIGIAIAAGAVYLLSNTKVRVEIDGEAVTVQHSGMVHANFLLGSVESVAVSGSGHMSRILVVTKEGLKYHMPCNCFQEDEMDSLLKMLRGA